MANQKMSGAYGTREWAEHTDNVILGCAHHCKYCYACTMAVMYGRVTAANWTNEVPRQGKTVKLFSSRAMIPSTHDITPQNISVVLPRILELLRAGNTLLIVSKPHLECVKELCARLSQYKDKVLFRFTVGSPDSDVLKFWEPNAPSCEERLEALKYAFGEGYQTSLSIEPMLDTLENIKVLISRAIPFITDAIWVGKPNALIPRLKINGAYDPDTAARVQQFEAWYSDDNIRAMYQEFKDNGKIKWKESIKRVVGIKIPTEKGLDM
ncbi:MAG: hypothetical protein A2487_13545 [Candidatus Raymondbacteria bacterium RifOxyC12_full_50_8]|uniref:Radical SAM core domain-containing protein n=1 Tax=Candidatus Raymondbacteria bacterium RIFOXYD12_FULL_49_13 TaxID=1817890 RepID=A0A1F7F7U5_UNCRA|nr:MAG: hypothetical protein A2248_13655 [Candidatus Raymondbacteria bacterium RIFOXYA2_FULL_49_16]OGJ95171.1 MAG: hypothetical protein A2350_09510 [Candidatus Raymondbacteria bacterium RifOxyB12_full_50_8]OGK00383.1 MAG: hypothetical protein A2487_13545 [Candidatus Raymondbacteria bacterium RifOxyC12_full_50_8]OGK02701.1 MAG: hypothetical protein A2519_09570 [Candidatus Raymondbacteria bacterium RIFOXYD12_FULL_49_13]OGP42347.1 MAG: hypothetical protein A2324_20240 [Candidatus Raymondbacteria b